METQSIKYSDMESPGGNLYLIMKKILIASKHQE
jgi:hypothetical protein